MESDEITLKVVNQVVHVRLDHSRVDQEAWGERRGVRVAGERGNEGRVAVGRVITEVPPDVVRVWIRPDLVFEPAGVDLEIVFGITPAAEAGGGRVVKEGRVVNVVRV